MTDSAGKARRGRGNTGSDHITACSSESVTARWNESGPKSLRANRQSKVTQDAAYFFRPPAVVRVFIGFGLLIVPMSLMVNEPGVIFLGISLIVLGMAIHGRYMAAWLEARVV